LQQYRFWVEQARRLPIDMASRYRVAAVRWHSHDTGGTYPYARAILAALNVGHSAGTGYNQSVDRLDALDDLLPRVPSELQRRLTTAYGTIQLADSRITGDLYPNASGPDGRIIVRTAPRDSWFWPAAFLDPRTGQLEPVWPGIDADMYGGWTPEGRVVAGALFTYSSLWRFTPNK